MMPRTFPRRLFLRGAGGAMVALPLLEEMQPRRAHGQAADPPLRFMTLFFGLGLWPSWQQERLNGPLGTYAPVASKMSFFTNTTLAQQNPQGAHSGPAPVVFVGEKHSSTRQAGGPSVDQIVRNAKAPTAPTLASGIWFNQRVCLCQAVRVYNLDGSPRLPIRRPSKVFETLFGAAPPGAADSSGPPDPKLQLERRLRRSVLDTMLAQYKRLAGEGSYLGRASRLKVDLHLNSVREIERQLAPADNVIDAGMRGGDGSACAMPAVTDPPLGARADIDKNYSPGPGAAVMAWQDIQKVYRLHADLWVMALKCDIVRYGNLMHESAGGHMNLEGTYSAMGQSTDWPGDSQHDSYFHARQAVHARLYQHFASANLSYFLQQLDAVVEPNGKTLLDNSTVLIGTESGENHNRSGIFRAIAGGGGRFKPGWYEQRMNVIDLYNMVARAHGVQAQIGSRTGVKSEGDASSALA